MGYDATGQLTDWDQGVLDAILPLIMPLINALNGP
jgi:hypothetical protein